VTKKRGPGIGDAEARNDDGSGRNKLPYHNRPSLFKIDHVTTADMADGQPLPPYMDDGVVWCVVRRQRGRTLWRRIILQSQPEQSDVATLDGGLHSPSVR
jgi:hypothetical protein